MTNLLVIGGSDAGISAALRAREIDPTSQVTIVLADSYPNYSVCGIPYFFSGEVSDWHNLAHRTAQEIAEQGIDLLLNHVASQIDPQRKTVTVLDPAGSVKSLPYDKLIIATGARPVEPAIDGLDLPGVFLLRTIGDMLTIQTYLETRGPKTIGIIGAGYIGLEMAEALTQRGMSVTLLQRSGSILVTVDSELGALAQQELEGHGVIVRTGINVQRFSSASESIVVEGSNGFSEKFDMVLVSVGVVPDSVLAQTAGIALGLRGAIRVNRRMETNVTDIYAAGDCVETWHRVLNRYNYAPLGSTAHKQGRIAGENAAGGYAEFAGTLGTQVIKLFDLVAARTGLRHDEAQAAGYTPLTTSFQAWDHKAYYPDAHTLTFRVTGDRHTGQLLGAQMLGHRSAEVAKRIDIFAAALFQNMSMAGLSELDLSYSPPFSSPWDPVQMATQDWERHVE